MPTRIIRNKNGNFVRRKPLEPSELSTVLEHQDPEIAAKQKEARAGQRTVALVGMAPTNCALAPFDDLDVEIWSLNETHAFEWMTRCDRWFQLHPEESFTREVAVRNVRGHYDWLKEKRGIPIYMQNKYDEIPDSVAYPLYEVRKKFFTDITAGGKPIKELSSTFAYMLALALYEDNFDRIEIYGFEAAAEGIGSEGYVYQKPGILFWLGVAKGMGKKLILPENTQLFLSPLYGYEWYPKDGIQWQTQHTSKN